MAREKTGTASLLDRIEIDRSTPIPPYYQLREAIRREIHSGALVPGDKLPTVQQMAKACDVSAFTVGRAVGDLAREGLVVSRTRKGTVVAEAFTPSIEFLVPFDRDQPVVRHDFISGMLAEADHQFGREERRAFLSYVERSSTSAAEILAVSRVKHVDGLLVYRPEGAIAAELAEVAREMAVVSLFYTIPDSNADSVCVDPTQPLRKLLRQYLDSGVRHFAFMGENVMTKPQGDGQVTPYVLFYNAFMDFVAEVGIEPVVCLSEEPWPKAVPDIVQSCPDVPDGCVLVGTTPECAYRLGKSLPGRCHPIAYTEHLATYDKYGQHVDILLAPAPRCVRKSVELLRARISAGLAEGPRVETIEPHIVPRGTRPPVQDEL